MYFDDSNFVCTVYNIVYRLITLFFDPDWGS